MSDVRVIRSYAPSAIGRVTELRAAAQRQVWQPWTVGNVTEDDYATLMRLSGCILR